MSESLDLETPERSDMIASLLLALPTLLAPLPVLSLPLRPAQEADEYDTKLTAAGDDVEKLWELQAWCKEQGRNSDARKVLKKIVSVDGGHEAARKALGHHFYDEQWFSSRTELSSHRRKEERAMKEKGFVRMDKEWVPIADAPFLRMGWAKDETGHYQSPATAARMLKEAKLREDGYQQQDTTWIEPDEFDKWREGLYKCGDDWLAGKEAEAFHSNLTTPWRIPSPNGKFIIVSTCKRRPAELAAWHADRTYGDLARIFGLQPLSTPVVTVVDGVSQYNIMAAGNQEMGIQPAENSGWSSIHYAFFGELMFEMNEGTPEYNGGGVCYYAADQPNLEPYGKHAVRHAAALSYIEKIDPSWDSISRMMASASSGGGAQLGNFWQEKKVPLWLRFGAASYVERYYKDADSKNPNWPMEWSTKNLAAMNSMRLAPEVLAFQIDPGQPEDSRKWMSECGLLVSFMLHGKDAEVSAAHGAFKAALKSGGSTEEAVANLVEVLGGKDAEIRAYGDLPVPKTAEELKAEAEAAPKTEGEAKAEGAGSEK
ncbi:MAG: hypothetical protein ACI835_005474 [Planctomycetota bacterium]